MVQFHLQNMDCYGGKIKYAASSDLISISENLIREDVSCVSKRQEKNYTRDRNWGQ